MRGYVVDSVGANGWMDGCHWPSWPRKQVTGAATASAWAASMACRQAQCHLYAPQMHTDAIQIPPEQSLYDATAPQIDNGWSDFSVIECSPALPRRLAAPLTRLFARLYSTRFPHRLPLLIGRYRVRPITRVATTQRNGISSDFPIFRA